MINVRLIKMQADQGIILINKVSGKSSAAVVAQVRRLLGMKRVGHCGTLDPFATGVLPIIFGRATAAVPYMSEYDKKYRCQVQLGSRTDTMDREGEVIARAPEDFDSACLEDRSYVERILNAFLGEIKQQAPLYSAVKVEGKPLYKYARQGEEVDRPWRTVYVHDIKLLDIYYIEGEALPRLDIMFSTSKGTYIRSLADAIGEKLGCYAHAAELERSACGPFALEQSVKIDDLFARFDTVERDPKAFTALIADEGIVLPTLAAFVDFPTHAVERSEAVKLAHGQEVRVLTDDSTFETISFTYNNILLAVGSVNQGVAKVKRVFVDSSAEFLEEGSVDGSI
ncbi:MAG: tRNA pseudouridine(55) synthase TruB [Eubacteriales bacterium]|nr:tRNA pseudouridine(55) synthase TruB [Eubacteriales bacterium]MDD4323369.1 tRNA pseudouridine(55) synthase TruB [Eubacteriales bacterium]MDD4541214.1 tRNA pseudouridine(55) synthase TruB [Eubacteriales bacterium]